MQAYLQRLLVRLGADTKKYYTEMRSAQRFTQRWGQNMQTIGDGLTRTLSVPMLAVSGYSLKLGMDAIESENLFSVSMGNMEGAARRFSEQMRSELKLNSYEVRKNTGILYGMLDSMGLAEQEAYGMSTAMTKLSYDMASFYNLPTEEAFAKLQSGITGEAEPLKRLGILIDEATIKTYAYANGIAGVGEQLTQQQKVQARYGAIMAQTAKAQGDMARTLDQPSNRLRVLKQQAEETAIKLGMALMPVVENLLPVIEDVADAIAAMADRFSRMSPAAQQSVIQIAGLLAVAGPLTRVLGSGMTAASGLAGQVARSAKALEMLKKNTAKTNKTMGKCTSASRNVQAGLKDAGASAMVMKGNLVVLAATMGWMIGKAIRPYVESLLGLDDAQYKCANTNLEWVEQLTESEETFRTQIDLYNKLRKQLGLTGEEWKVGAEHTEKNARRLAIMTDKVRKLARAQVELQRGTAQANRGVMTQAQALQKVNEALKRHAAHVAKVNEKYGLMTQKDVHEHLQQLAKDFEDAASSNVHMNQLVEAFGDELEESLGKARDYKVELDALPEGVQKMVRSLSEGGHEGVAELAAELDKIPKHVDTTGGKIISGITMAGKDAGQQLEAELEGGLFRGADKGAKAAEQRLKALADIEIEVKVKPVFDETEYQKGIKDARAQPDGSW